MGDAVLATHYPYLGSVASQVFVLLSVLLTSVDFSLYGDRSLTLYNLCLLLHCAE